jgi:hypothetical protein
MNVCYCLERITVVSLRVFLGFFLFGVQEYLYCVLQIFYYIDRCELWGFIHEINSGISHVRYQFFFAGTTFTQL